MALNLTCYSLRILALSDLSVMSGMEVTSRRRKSNHYDKQAWKKTTLEEQVNKRSDLLAEINSESAAKMETEVVNWWFDRSVKVCAGEWLECASVSECSE